MGLDMYFYKLEKSKLQELKELYKKDGTDFYDYFRMHPELEDQVLYFRKFYGLNNYIFDNFTHSYLVGTDFMEVNMDELKDLYLKIKGCYPYLLKIKPEDLEKLNNEEDKCSLAEYLSLYDCCIVKKSLSALTKISFTHSDPGWCASYIYSNVISLITFLKYWFEDYPYANNYALIYFRE